MSDTAIIWVHADTLSRDHPVFAAAPDDAQAIYIWDAQDIERRGWSLKRCVFVLECLADMKVDIIEGQAQTALVDQKVFTAATMDPHRRRVIQALGKHVTVVAGPEFATVPNGTDMGRFFRYWNKVKSTAMSPTAKG